MLIRINSCFFCALAASAFLDAQTPMHTAAVELEFTPRVSAAYWAGGFMAEYSRAINNATPTVWLFDREGTRVTPPVPNSFPDAPSSEIHAVTADSSGNLYASAEAWANGGSGTGMICKISRGGQSIQVIRTDDFLAVALAVAETGEIWAFGLPLELQATQSTESDYMTLWRFDASGRVIDKSLPRSSFGHDIIPTHAFGDVGWPRLSANGTRVGLYSATANRWMEFDASTGKTLADLRVPRPKAADGSIGAIGMVVITESGDVYARSGYQTAVNEGSGILKLDKTNSKWMPQTAAPCQESCASLYGADGNHLIMRYGNGTSHSWTFAWVDASVLASAAH